MVLPSTRSPLSKLNAWIAVYGTSLNNSRQDGRFGDSFWSEDHFFRYLLRLLTSWATVYDVYYLEPQHRDKETESAEHFAARVQSLISEKIGVQPASFDGSVWYKKAEREKYRSALQKKSARELLACT